MAKKTTKKTEEKKISKKRVKPLDKEKVEKKEEKIEEVKDMIEKESAEEAALKKKRLVYYFAVGRRKSALAKVFLFKNGSGQVEVNGRDAKDYFSWEPYYSQVYAPFLIVGQKGKLDAKCVVKGGGKSTQAEAVRLGISRALLKLNPIFRRPLKKRGFLTRDPRVKERKKYGLKRARRAPQWQKR